MAEPHFLAQGLERLLDNAGVDCHRLVAAGAGPRFRAHLDTPRDVRLAEFALAGVGAYELVEEGAEALAALRSLGPLPVVAFSVAGLPR